MKTLSQPLTGVQAAWPDYMQRALELAARVISTHPNPRVGCVLVQGDTVVGEGWHEAPGEAHAEVAALVAAGTSAAGATAFVTLEPCAHEGRTGPCSRALIAAGVKEVIIAVLDPNPAVAGKGVRDLEAAGIPVYHLAAAEAQARALNLGYFSRREQGVPRVTVKLAMSLDGRTAMADGQSKWITGADARSDVQRLRLQSSAIITGVNTVLLDDPSLTVRSADLALTADETQGNRLLLERQPLRVVLDSKLRTPGTARLTDVDGKYVIFTAAAVESAALQADCIRQVPAGESGGVDLRSMLESLAADFECNDVLVESGPVLSGALLQAGLVDELIVYLAPKLLGSDARPLMELAGLDSLADAIALDWHDIKQVGSDLRLTLIPTRLQDSE